MFPSHERILTMKTTSPSETPAATPDDHIPESADALHFQIGPYVYSAIVVDSPLLFENGHEVMGICSARDRRIYLCRDPHERLDTLCHELMHAWLFGVAKPETTEGWCNLFGTVCSSIIL